MTTAYFTHKRFLDHDLPGHPENAGRLRSIWAKIEAGQLNDRMAEHTPKPISEDILLGVHSTHHINRLGEIEAMGAAPTMLDGDTYFSPQSYTIARIAAAGVVEAVDAVMQNEADNALAVVRPPGHHAMPDHAMGFCLLGNVGVAARYAQKAYDIQRVMIVDYDVHHGNGTEAMFYDDPSVLFLSSHQYPFYPGTGALEHTGRGEGHGYTVNIPMPRGHGDDTFAALYEEIVWPVARRYQPDLIIISAGFDAHWTDPLAGMRLSLSGYAHITRELVRMAEELCGGKIVFALEGGYDLEVVGNGVANVARILLGDDQIEDPLGPDPKPKNINGADTLIHAVRTVHNLD